MEAVLVRERGNRRERFVYRLSERVTASYMTCLKPVSKPGFDVGPTVFGFGKTAQTRMTTAAIGPVSLQRDK